MFVIEGLEKYQNEEKALPNEKQKYKVLGIGINLSFGLSFIYFY